MRPTAALYLLLMLIVALPRQVGALDRLRYHRPVLGREILESGPVPLDARWVTISGVSVAFKYYSLSYSQALAGFGKRLDLIPGLHLDLKTGLVLKGGLVGGSVVFKGTSYVVALKLVHDLW